MLPFLSDLYIATVDLPMRGAIQGGIIYATNETIPTLSPMCSSGNCTWDSYSSLEVCSKTANVTDMLRAEFLTVTNQKADDGTNVSVVMEANVTLPNGAWLDAGRNT